MDKTAELRRYKWIATSLFFLMVVIYIACETLLSRYNFAGYLKAFAEAGMVGALADWFAVTALFRHPLGLPIPHTNLIAGSKQKIGNNLGQFVTDNFLTEATLQPRLQKLAIAEKVGQWLLQENNRLRVLKEITAIIKNIMASIKDADIEKIISEQASALINKIPLNKVASDAIAKIIDENVQQDWITTLAGYLKDFLSENRLLVQKKVREESHFLIPGFVDDIIAEKITNGGIRYMNEIVSNLNHPARTQITGKLKDIAADIKNGGKWTERLDSLKNNLLSPDQVSQYSTMLWQYLKKQIQDDISKPESGIQNYLNILLKDIAISLTTDTQRQQSINSFIQEQALSLILKYKTAAAELISQTIANWPADELSTKLELEVGKDLQFIRINGTLVGGLVGLIIYCLTQWLQ